MNYEQLINSRNRPLSKYSIENTTPITSSITVDTNVITKKRCSAETANAAILSQKRRTIKKLNHHKQSISNENVKQDLINEKNNQINSDINIQQIDDELLKRLSQGKRTKKISIDNSFFFLGLDFVYVDKRTDIRWIGQKLDQNQ